MSLSSWREEIDAVVAGDDDPRVREHLRECDECRAHYDRLVMAARVLAGSPEPLRSEHDALLNRLRTSMAMPTAAPKTTPRWWWFGAMAAVAAALMLVLIPRGGSGDPEREIVLRGGDDFAPTLSFGVYAKAKSGAGGVRLLAQFPQSGEARASEGDWLQVKAPPGVAVVAMSDSGAVISFEPSGSQSLTKGTYRVFAAKASLEEVKKAASLALENGKLKLAAEQTSGVLVVSE